MNIIGLGKAGCAIAEMFKQYKQYDVLQIDSSKDYENQFVIEKRSTSELYDSMPVKIKIANNDEILIFMCGSGKISGATLRVLENFKDRDIFLYYIFPKLDLLDKKSKLRNRAHCSILQEFARSGVFKKMFIFRNDNLKDIVGNTSVIDFYKKINELIFNSIHMLNFFSNSKPVFDTFQDDLNTCRISTISSVDIETGLEKDFFSLKNVNQIKYFFGVNRLRIEEDEELLSNVEKLSTSNAHEECIASYGIYETSYDYDFCLAIKSTAEIQTIEKEK